MKIAFALVGLAFAERNLRRQFNMPAARARRQNLASDDERRGKNYNTGASSGYQNNSVYETNSLTCWHCDAMSFEECETKGMQKTCHANEVIIIRNFS